MALRLVCMHYSKFSIPLLIFALRGKHEIKERIVRTFIFLQYFAKASIPPVANSSVSREVRAAQECRDNFRCFLPVVEKTELL